jgi:AraC-like DNA-binding protein
MPPGPIVADVGAAEERQNRLLLRARDRIDRHYREPLDVPALAAVACMSQAHFIRSFKTAFGETPHRYLQRRRIERAMERLRRTDRSVSEVCLEVGWTSFATFSRTFREVVGCTPSEYRATPPVSRDGEVPTCFVKSWTRPATSSSSGTATGVDAA